MTTEEKLIRAVKRHWDFILCGAFLHLALALGAMDRPAREGFSAGVAAVFWAAVGAIRRVKP